jgi:hypothetical protein
MFRDSFDFWTLFFDSCERFSFKDASRLRPASVAWAKFVLLSALSP